MQHLLVLAELPDEFFNSGAVENTLSLVLDTLVCQRDLHAGIQKSQFAQTVGQNLKLELGGNRENGRVRLERDERASALGGPDHLEFLRGLAPLKTHVV